MDDETPTPSDAEPEGDVSDLCRTKLIPGSRHGLSVARIPTTNIAKALVLHCMRFAA
jgi:hypothetical protein